MLARLAPVGATGNFYFSNDLKWDERPSLEAENLYFAVGPVVGLTSFQCYYPNMTRRGPFPIILEYLLAAHNRWHLCLDSGNMRAQLNSEAHRLFDRLCETVVRKRCVQRSLVISLYQCTKTW
ncbi:uncharacterized protein L3040_004013 [Drepanopeziza brunnea f. sp. 'multigermtubi']|uniref:uncharacterized protein n=1 Tax=Drepanopeziza brunnea f. sp. 'multigermtubi' TaxID=698441 RepID=UPI002395A021|nr:hypothetical protein L3040_004013 [Drepanopeziza brunnea f. sp. 'multigermtubi']